METENLLNNQEYLTKKTNSNTNNSNTTLIDDAIPLPAISNQIDDEAFKVYVRVRPLNKKELEKKSTRKNINILKIQDQMIFVLDPETQAQSTLNSSKEKTYVFDYIFGENDNTSFVYEKTMQSLLDNILNGYNATLFAYGMTGAGKTHTLFGDMQKEILSSDVSGMIMLTLNDLFNRISQPRYCNTHEFIIKMSYLEIYNEHVRDLLKAENQNLMIVEDPIKGVFVADLLEVQVNSINDVLNIILSGNSKRIMASTSANQFSSRSHAIIQVIIEKKNKLKDIIETMTLSKLSLIDLAGSERASVTDNKGLRMLEGANINRSLLSLGNCINILSDQNKKGAFVPYRDSKLTRLLKDSLGGNTKTIMVACVSPCFSCYEETVNTLKYANRAKSIKRKIQQNVKEVELHVSQYKEIIENLKGEITHLREQLKSSESPRKDSIDIDRKEENILMGNSHSYSVTSIEDQKYKNCNNYEIYNNDSEFQKTSNKIFENLEQNLEINQSLKELNDLEDQNKQILIALQTLLESIPKEDIEQIENTNKQIMILKNTMENNEKIKRDVENSLKMNLMESKALKDRLIEYASSIDSFEDIHIVKKLLDIEKLDVHKQNVEIKKEALTLAKEKMIKNKQISLMEEELKNMRKQLEEKDKLIASNKEIINTLVNNKESSKKDLDQLIIKPITSNNNNMNNNSNQKQQYGKSIDNNIVISNDKIDTTQKQGMTSKSTLLKELLLNLEKKINKSLVEIDEKVNSPVKSLLKQINYDTQSSIERLKLSKDVSLVCQESISKNNNTNLSIQITENNTSLNLTPMLDKIKQTDLKEIGNVIHNQTQKTHENTEPESNKYLMSGTYLKSLQYNQNVPQQQSQLFGNSETKKEFNSLLVQYRKQKNTTKNDPKRSPTDKLSKIEPFSPVNNDPNSQNASRECIKSKRSDDNSEDILLSGKEETGENFHQLSNSSIKNKDTVKTSTTNGINISQSQNLKLPSNRIGSKIQSHIRGITPVMNHSRNNEFLESNDNLTLLPMNKASNIINTNQLENKLSDVEAFQAKLRQQSSNAKSNNLTKNMRRPSTPHLEKNTESIDKLNLMQGKRDRSINRSINFGNMTPHKLSKNTTTIMNPVTCVEQSLQIETINHEQKKVCEIRSLDQERENLKLFRSKINALANMNLNEKNINTHISQEIKGLIEEFRVKNYIISKKDQESLRLLGELNLKIANTPIKSKEKEPRGRCASVNISKNHKAESKPSAKKPIVVMQQFANENLVPTIKPITKNPMSKGVFSNLSNTYSQILNPKGIVQSQKFSKGMMPTLPFRNNINALNGEKIENNGLESKRNGQITTQNCTEHFEFVMTDSIECGQSFKPVKSALDVRNSQVDVYQGVNHSRSSFLIQSQENYVNEIDKVIDECNVQYDSNSRKVDFGI